MLFTLFVAVILIATGGRHPGPAGLEINGVGVNVIALTIYLVLLVLTVPVPLV